MSKNVVEIKLPDESRCKAFIAKVDYEDAFKVTLNKQTISIEDIYLQIFTYTPKWVNSLFKFRNSIGGLFRLDTSKEIEEINAKNLKVGLKAGIFKIYDIKPNEIIAGEDDRHLNFRVSILKRNNEVVLGTLVKYNNTAGKIYMAIIMPFHKLIVKTMLANAVKNKRI